MLNSQAADGKSPRLSGNVSLKCLLCSFVGSTKRRAVHLVPSRLQSFLGLFPDIYLHFSLLGLS